MRGNGDTHALARVAMACSSLRFRAARRGSAVRIGSVVSLLLLLICRAQGFPPLPNATCVNRARASSVAGPALAAIWRDPANVPPILRAALLSPKPWRRVPRWPFPEILLASPTPWREAPSASASASETRSGSGEQADQKPGNEAADRGQQARAEGSVRFQGGHGGQAPHSHQLVAAQVAGGQDGGSPGAGAEEGREAEDGEAGGEEGHPKRRMIDILEGATGLDLDGDSLVAGNLYGESYAKLMLAPVPARRIAQTRRSANAPTAPASSTRTPMFERCRCACMHMRIHIHTCLRYMRA